jgi:hypothetical protein
VHTTNCKTIKSKEGKNVSFYYGPVGNAEIFVALLYAIEVLETQELSLTGSHLFSQRAFDFNFFPRCRFKDAIKLMSKV